MKIEKVEAFAISIPLRAAVSDAVRRITHRDSLKVKIRTADGIEGVGFTLGYDGARPWWRLGHPLSIRVL